MKKEEVRGFILYMKDVLSINDLTPDAQIDTYFELFRYEKKDAVKKAFIDLLKEKTYSKLPLPAEILQHIPTRTSNNNLDVSCVSCRAKGKPGSGVDEILRTFAIREPCKETKYEYYPDGQGICYQCRLKIRIKKKIENTDDKNKLNTEETLKAKDMGLI